MVSLILAFGFASFIKGVLMFIFILSALVLVLIILLQEPKGGGLSSAFGGAGAETFGVQTGGINRFTAYVATTFIVTAILYAAYRPDNEAAPSDATRTVATPEPAGELTPPTESDSSGGDAGDSSGSGDDKGGAEEDR